MYRREEPFSAKIRKDEIFSPGIYRYEGSRDNRSAHTYEETTPTYEGPRNEGGFSTYKRPNYETSMNRKYDRRSPKYETPNDYRPYKYEPRSPVE